MEILTANLTRPKAILFDMGGVLQDASVTWSAETWQRGTPPAVERPEPFDWFLAMSKDCIERYLALEPPRPAVDVRPVIADWLRRDGMDASPEAVARWFRRMLWWEAQPIYGFVRPALERLRALGFRMGVVSNTLLPGDALRANFASAGILEHFDVVVFSAEAGVNKPDPRIFDIALDTMGIGPDRAWFVATLQAELQRLGSSVRYEASAQGNDIATAQGEKAKAASGGSVVAETIYGPVTINPPPPPDPTRPDPDAPRRQYLTELRQWWQNLPLAALGSDEGTEKLIPFDIIPRIISAIEWRKLSKGIEQLGGLRDEVLRQRAQMRQSYMAALNQANLSASYAGVVRQRDRDARDAAGAVQSFEDAARLAPNEPEYTINLARARLLSALWTHARHGSPLIDHASFEGFTVDEAGSTSVLLDSVGVLHNHVDWGRDVGEF